MECNPMSITIRRRTMPLDGVVAPACTEAHTEVAVIRSTTSAADAEGDLGMIPVQPDVALMENGGDIDSLA